ncbi:hypothetical protein A2U01_0000040 [Trifolium medium]|uniref:Uncharacterized protein n=1 Tax=Trifolium medium TaxID=97028 RepID=A0A392LXB4_9FABA|nr:hypothetical protein [Trifolium medium]
MQISTNLKSGQRLQYKRKPIKQHQSQPRHLQPPPPPHRSTNNHNPNQAPATPNLNTATSTPKLRSTTKIKHPSLASLNNHVTTNHITTSVTTTSPPQPPPRNQQNPKATPAATETEPRQVEQIVWPNPVNPQYSLPGKRTEKTKGNHHCRRPVMKQNKTQQNPDSAKTNSPRTRRSEEKQKNEKTEEHRRNEGTARQFENEETKTRTKPRWPDLTGKKNHSKKEVTPEIGPNGGAEGQNAAHRTTPYNSTS